MLRKEQTVGRSRDRDAKEAVQWTKILHGKFGSKHRHEMLSEIVVRGSEDDIINIQKNIRHVRAIFVDKEIVITTTMCEAQKKYIIDEPLIPSPQSLFEAIKRFF